VPSRTVGASACYLSCIIKSEEDGRQERDRRPYMFTQTGGETQPERSTIHLLRQRNCWGFRVGTWNVDSLSGRALIETLAVTEVDRACIQETQWRGSGCRFLGAKGNRMGGKDRSDGVGIFVPEKWVDSAVSVERHSERVLILKTVLDNGLLNVLTVYYCLKKLHSLKRFVRTTVATPHN